MNDKVNRVIEKIPQAVTFSDAYIAQLIAEENQKQKLKRHLSLNVSDLSTQRLFV